MRKPFAYVTKQGKLVRADVLEGYATKESKQADPFVGTGDKGLVTPPYNVKALVELLDANTYHLRSCRVKAQDVAGNGWSIVPSSTSESSTGVAEDANKAMLEDWFSNLAWLDEEIKAAQVDYESIGWGSLELTFALGKPSGIYHVPSQTLRRHHTKSKWLQRVGSKAVWFQDAHSDQKISAATGAPTNSDDAAASILISWHNQHPISSVYGVPDIIPALGAIIGDISRRDYNIAFFDNYGVPAYAVFITGDFDPGEPSLDSEGNPTGPTPLEESIEEHFSALAKEPHSVLVLSVPTSVSDDFGGQGGQVKVEIEPLSLQTQEASFRMYRQDNRDEVLTAHGVDPYRIGIAETGSLGGATARESRGIYKESVISPKQKTIENAINHIIIRKGFGITEWAFQFNEMDDSDANEDLAILVSLFSVGAATPRQIVDRFASRFGLSTSGMEHPALNAHYIGGYPVDIAMSDFEIPSQDVAKSIKELQQRLSARAGASEQDIRKVLRQLVDSVK